MMNYYNEFYVHDYNLQWFIYSVMPCMQNLSNIVEYKNEESYAQLAIPLLRGESLIHAEKVYVKLTALGLPRFTNEFDLSWLSLYLTVMNLPFYELLFGSQSDSRSMPSKISKCIRGYNKTLQGGSKMNEPSELQSLSLGSPLIDGLHPLYLSEVGCNGQCFVTNLFMVIIIWTGY